ncbi:MAG: hypothetical protein Q9225_005557 [Loekoesia sp. 1 TL-2023]
MINKVYAFLYGSSLYRLSTFETIWTVITYAIIEPVYTYRFGHNPQLRLAVQKEGNLQKDLPKMKRPSKRLMEGLTYVLPLLLMDITMIKKYAGVPLEEMAMTGNHDLKSASMSCTYLRPTFHRVTWDSPFQTTRAVPASAPTSRTILVQLFFSITIFDQLFFLFHLALHKVSYFNKIHSVHHGHNEIHPQITNRLDITERLGLVMLANFSLNSINAHVLTRTIYIPLFVGLLTDIHSGLELPWAYDKILPRGWGAGSKRHSEHHEHGKKYYEPFFTICDEFFFKDVQDS